MTDRQFDLVLSGATSFTGFRAGWGSAFMSIYAATAPIWSIATHARLVSEMQPEDARVADDRVPDRRLEGARSSIRERSQRWLGHRGFRRAAGPFAGSGRSALVGCGRRV
jgi:hypothetical protein